MKPINGYFLIKPEVLHWRLSNLMKIPNADFLERTQSEILGARLWRLPSKSANTLHKHIRAEEFYFVVEGMGRIRVGDETLTNPRPLCRRRGVGFAIRRQVDWPGRWFVARQGSVA